MVAGIGCNGAVRRIRTPNPQDVLSGRGGGINSHPGNKAYREWVRLRKEDYNLAVNKKEKTDVAMQVVRMVRQQNPPGRFLQKDPTAVRCGGHWWIEIDDSKALAKTTQALREGASKIREQSHQQISTNAVKQDEQENENMTKRRRISEEAIAPTGEMPPIGSIPVPVPLSVSAPLPPAVVTTEKERNVPYLAPNPKELIPLPTPDPKSEQDVGFLSQDPESMLLPHQDYKMALEMLQENVNEAKHMADQQHRQEQQLEKEQHLAHPKTLVAPLTSNKAFNEKYRQKRVNGLNIPRPIVGPSQQPNGDGSGTDIEVPATTWDKAFNPLNTPDLDFESPHLYL